MKIFNTLKEGLAHRLNCPFCDSLLVASSKSTGSYEDRFSFQVSSGYNEAFVVFKETETVILIEDPKLKSKPSKKLSINGQFWTGLYVNCEDKECCKYSYSLLLKFNIQSISLEEISLANESLTFDENDLITEIRNRYGSDDTLFITCDRSGLTKTAKLPLLSINLDNIEEVLNRARKLIVFL
jgi:hypothetical protein